MERSRCRSPQDKWFGSQSDRGNIRHSSMPVRRSMDALRPRPICSATSRSPRRVFTRWCSAWNAGDCCAAPRSAPEVSKCSWRRKPSDSAAEAHRRGIGRHDGHHSHVLAAEHVLADRHRRRRQDVAVRLAVGELEQQGVVDFQTGGRAVVPYADEDHPRTGADPADRWRTRRWPRARRIAVECLFSGPRPIRRPRRDSGGRRRCCRSRRPTLRHARRAACTDPAAKARLRHDARH